jgi:hypothetical protein
MMAAQNWFQGCLQLGHENPIWSSFEPGFKTLGMSPNAKPEIAFIGLSISTYP